VEIQAGRLVAFYLFDVCETVDLSDVARSLGPEAVPARLAPRPATPASIQYDNPPLSFDGQWLGSGVIEGFRARIRLFEYGIVSVALSRAFAGDWADLVTRSAELIENTDLEARAEGLCRQAAARLGPALRGVRDNYISEDYLVIAVNSLEGAPDADRLLRERGAEIAAMLRGEREPLSDQERASVLDSRISYLAHDLVIPTWNAAFVYDTLPATQGALDILEFANTQLLEFRYYDRLLDRELAKIYAHLQRPRRSGYWLGRRHTRAARQVHALLIDLNELTDRTENAVKFVGDPYAVRLFRLAAERLGLASWKAEVQSKLQTLGDIHRFAVEQSGMSRGQFLELAIVLILLFELVLFFMGIMT
jgi:hypothetical protein